jgi:tetratricopeptide (TPR) repeat protein
MLEELNRDFPDILMVQSLLGEAYIENSNNGKAIKIFENLVNLDSNNASFAGYLAKAYLLRGWHKKAVQSFKGAIELDEDTLSLWMGLSEAYIAGEDTNGAKEILEELLRRKGDENQDLGISAYFSLFMIDFKNNNLENMKENLEKLANVAIKYEDARENIAWMLFMIADQMVRAQRFEHAKEILDRAERIAPDKQDIKKLKDKVDKFSKLGVEFSSLEYNRDYSDDFIAFIAFKIFPEESIGSEIYIRSAECEFLENVNVLFEKSREPKYLIWCELLSHRAYGVLERVVIG